MLLARALRAAPIALALAVSTAQAGPVLIINGASTSPEAGTTGDITSNLKTLNEAVGNTVTVADTRPASLAGYSAVWDVRFFDGAALTAADVTAYTGFLQGGGAMFLMGENASFPTRNSSIFGFIAGLGGGALGFVSPCATALDTQTVNAPFTGPAPVGSVTYPCAGGFDGSGTGLFITQNGTIGSGIAFAPGTLAGATAGTLTSILDVNFMQGSYGIDLQNLTKNLIRFIDTGGGMNGGGTVPEPGTLALLAFLGVVPLLFRGRNARHRKETIGV
jgi:hypothetical protein